MYKGSLFIFSIFISTFLFAQKNDLKSQLAFFEKTNAHEAAIAGLKKILASSNLTPSENIAVKTALIHHYQELQQWDSCLIYCQSEIAIAHRQNDKLAEATFYKLLGNTCYHIPDKEKAVAYWKKCIAVSESINHSLLLEQCYHNIGSVILESGKNYDEAERNFQKAIQLSVANKTDTTELGNLHYRLLATLYQETGRNGKADTLFTTVVTRARQLNDSLRIAEALMFYAVLLSKEMKFDKSIQTGKEALLISQKFNKLDMEQTALGLLASNYVKSGNYREAFRYLSDQNRAIEKRFNTDLNSKISDAEAKFKTSELQHENEIASIKAKKEKQIYLTGFGALLGLAAFAFFYFYQKRNVKQKALIQLQVQEEKERLSRDLHDNLGSQMALLSNNIENLDTHYRKQLSIDENIKKVKGTSRQLLQTLRETIWILNKEQVTAQEFFDKLIDYTHRYLQSYPGIQLKVEEEFEGNRLLNSNEALQLFRICQEVITNACKYSGSESLLLKGHTTRDSIAVMINDFGKGYSVSLVNTEGHYGLKNMQRRAKLIGADLQTDATPGKGVSVTVTL